MIREFCKLPASAKPHSQQSKINWLRLARSHRVGPVTFVRLINRYKNATAALKALPDIAKNAGIAHYMICDVKTAELEWQTGHNRGFIPLFLNFDLYPQILAQTADAPTFLWAKGNIELLKNQSIAIVGARNASSLGQRMAKIIAQGLGKFHYNIISGFARGIDTVAHEASLDSGTIAVFAGGLDVIYPKKNVKLAARIMHKGLCLSEQPIGFIPQARSFPQRNRIIAGLARAVVVIEGAARSGSLITARLASDIGREVMAVPGNPLDARASGCNNLIRDGATLVRSAQDVHDSLQIFNNFELKSTQYKPQQQSNSKQPAQPKSEPAPHSKPAPPTDQVGARILDLLGPNQIAEDSLIRDIGLPTFIIAQQLTALELDGHITRHPGGMISRTI